MILLSIDPGTVESAFVLYDGNRDSPVIGTGTCPNAEVLVIVQGSPADHLAVEMVDSYGMAVGRTVFETCVWIGRFVQAWGDETFSLTYRGPIKRHLCGSPRAKDPNVRQALIDKFGGDPDAIGGVKCPKCKGKGWFGAGRPECITCEGGKWQTPPGPLHDISGDGWAALALAVYWWNEEVEERN